jgi:hypothetical protein
MTNLLPDSSSSSGLVTNERQMTRKDKTEQRANPVDKADRVDRRFPGTTLTPQVI